MCISKQCNTKQHCKMLQHIVTHCSTLQHIPLTHRDLLAILCVPAMLLSTYYSRTYRHLILASAKCQYVYIHSAGKPARV